MTHRVVLVHPTSPPASGRAVFPPMTGDGSGGTIGPTSSSSSSSSKAAKPLTRGLWLLLLLFCTAVAGLLTSTRHLLLGSSAAASAASEAAATLLEGAIIGQHADASPLPQAAQVTDERLLRLLVEECSKGEDSAIWVDSRGSMAVQPALDMTQPCPALDIMLRGAERGVGMCTDAMLYVQHAGGRLIPAHANATAAAAYQAACPSNARLFLETLYDEFLGRQPGVLHLMLPNNEHMWTRDAHMHEQMQVFLCKTRFCEQTLQQHVAAAGLSGRVLFMGHTSSDPTVDTPAARSKALQFLHIKGKSGLKHTNQLLECWRRRPDLPPLTVVGRFSWEEARAAVAAPNIAFYPNVSANYSDGQTPLITFQQVRALQLQAPVHLCPSEREGFGHYINEARAAGAFIVSTDHPPMNELVTEEIGALIRPERTDSYKEMALASYHPIIAFMRPQHICAAVDRVMRLQLPEIERRGRLARQRFEQDKAAWLARMRDLKLFLEQRQQQPAVSRHQAAAARQRQPPLRRGGPLTAAGPGGPQAD